MSVVINEEWPIQRAGQTPHQGWKPLRDLNTAIATIQPQNLGEAMIQAELLNSWNQLYLTHLRCPRACAGRGLVDSIPRRCHYHGHPYLFGYPNFAMHMVMTGILAATLELVVVLIIDLDRPFRGEISVTPDLSS